MVFGLFCFEFYVYLYFFSTRIWVLFTVVTNNKKKNMKINKKEKYCDGEIAETSC